MKSIPANQSSRNSPRLRQPYTHAQRGHFTSLDLTRGQPRSRIHGQSTIRQFSRAVSVGCPVIGRAEGRTPLFPALRPCLAGFTHQSSQSSMWRCKPTHSSPPTLGITCRAQVRPTTPDHLLLSRRGDHLLTCDKYIRNRVLRASINSRTLCRDCNLSIPSNTPPPKFITTSRKTLHSTTSSLQHFQHQSHDEGRQILKHQYCLRPPLPIHNNVDKTHLCRYAPASMFNSVREGTRVHRSDIHPALDLPCAQSRKQEEMADLKRRSS